MDEKKVREAISCINDLIQLMPSIDKSAVEHLETAIGALEKQLPMRAEFLHMVDDKRARFKCKCGNTFVHECPTFPYGVMDYCDNCGQRLDWSEQS